jgi:hypothetical protein
LCIRFSSESSKSAIRIEAMFVDKYGIAVEVEGGVSLSVQQISKLRDMIMIVMDRNGISDRKIGLLFNLHHQVVRAGIDSIPLETRSHYARLRLEAVLESA